MKKLIAVAVLAAGTPAFAEARAAAPVGPRVRARFVTADGSRTSVTGRVLAADLDSMTILPAQGEAVVVPVGRIDRFDRSGGRRSRGGGLLRGAGLGFALGAVSGTLVEATATREERGTATRGENVFFGAVALGASSALLGAVVGVFAPGEHWVRTEPGKVRVTLAPTRGGAAASVRVSF
jgi:uncharacterized protein YndB with AHSA1/START domain